MRKLFTGILTICFTAMSFSQTVIETPKHGFSSSINVKIVRIELKDSSAVLWFHTTSSPGSTISIPENTYIVPSGSSEKLFLTSADGIAVGKSVPLPASGSIDYKLIFPGIEPGVTSIDYGEEGGNWHIYDIILKDLPSGSAIPEEISGHWFNTENGEWEISFLDTVVVYGKKLWSYAGIKYKNHEGYFIIKNKNSISELPVKLDKDGYLILKTSAKSSVLGKDALTIRKTLKNNEDLFAPPVFKYDSVIFSGYLKGYTPRIGVRTGTMYVNNILTGNQDNFLINVSDNGYFSVKIPLYYSHDIFITSDLFSESVFLEPGKDLFLMIDPDLEAPMFMGENALLNSDMHALRKINAIDNYDIMQQRILNMSPAGYKTYFLDLRSRELRTLDSIIKARPLTASAIQLKKLSIDYKYASRLMEYSMSFEGAYRRINKIPSSQRTLPVKIEKPGAEYYDFVTEEQANNPLAILASDYYYYINRLKYNDLIRTPVGFSTVELMRAVEDAGFRLTDEEKAMMADLEANIDKEAYNETNAFIQKYSDRYSDFSRKYSTHFSEMTKTNKDQPLTASIIEKYFADQGVELTDEEKEMLTQKSSIDNSESVRKNRDLMSKYNLQIDNFNSDHSNEISVVFNRRSKVSRNENIEKTFGVRRGLATDIMEAQDECRHIIQKLTPIPAENVQSVVKPITTPFISWYIEKCNNETISKIAENKKQPLPADKKPTTSTKLKSAFVETPVAKADILFETIVSKYKGKVVYVDFWATWCSPCRLENERIKPLKEALAGKDIVFVYITNQTSPLKTLNSMIPDIPGEHYRLTSDEWNYLSSKFNISGIPHKVLVDKNGIVVDPALMYMQNSALQLKLEKLLDQ